MEPATTCALRWRDLNLGSGRLIVPRSKTQAGERTVDISPDLLDELKAHRHRTRFAGQDDLVFPTSRGTINNRSNVLKRVLRPAIARANDQLAMAGLELIPAAVTMQNRKKNATVALDALIRGETPAPLGTSAQSTAPTASAEALSSIGGTSAVAAVSEGWS